ncbi:DUF192 domain-containing protein [Rhodanobacter sp. AS-Z3]|uniref:DUF192 domain-containing protein n=1 Tax=Rhodanobacter sp. AS-Z3 TaxID=3031330 RepID=UPI002479CDED|nr:DUF192 domain-containing protein [Rhodanobacter sp. AS-Z3]WEN15135.1 DUF192 domain-containing protein [Rhodanobacter sp. AS-Z3]
MNRWLTLLPLLLATSSCSTHSAATPGTVMLNGHRFRVELATNDASRRRGLMMRTALAADHGMLFVFPVIGPQGFWMKNTLIPLDMLYFDENRRLVSVQRDVPPCKADPCPTYPSAAPAIYVLELPAGTASRLGFKPGDVMSIDADIGPVR